MIIVKKNCKKKFIYIRKRIFIFDIICCIILSISALYYQCLLFHLITHVCLLLSLFKRNFNTLYYCLYLILVYTLINGLDSIKYYFVSRILRESVKLTNMIRYMIIIIQHCNYNVIILHIAM